MIAMVMMFLIQALGKILFMGPLEVPSWMIWHHNARALSLSHDEGVERQQSQHTQPILTGNLLLLTCCMYWTRPTQSVRSSNFSEFYKQRITILYLEQKKKSRRLRSLK